jgi:hypothetical protein
MTSGMHMVAKARRAREVIALAGLHYARRALRAPPPFANLIQLLQQDLAAIERAEA